MGRYENKIATDRDENYKILHKPGFFELLNFHVARIVLMKQVSKFTLKKRKEFTSTIFHSFWHLKDERK